jgi:ABC-type bacteriocin/lantibiotic exporter with double-glycine peptidase domain
MSAEMEGSGNNLAPWGSPSRMRILAIGTVIGGIAFVVIGLVLVLVNHHPVGWVFVAFALVVVAPVLVFTPRLRRQGRM